VIALILTAGIVAKRRFDAAWGYGPIAEQLEWPRALQAVGQHDPELLKGVSVIGLGRFIDEFSLWHAQPGSALAAHLIQEGALEKTSERHPKASQLTGAVPNGWKPLNWAKCEWYASPGFGYRHIEVTDLYLIVIDPITQEVIVLHEWYF
jgi:hypothetical protein